MSIHQAKAPTTNISEQDVIATFKDIFAAAGHAPTLVVLCLQNSVTRSEQVDFRVNPPAGTKRYDDIVGNAHVTAFDVNNILFDRQ
jgi:hypothetical protein